MRKLLSLFIVFGMLFVASPVLAGWGSNVETSDYAAIDVFQLKHGSPYAGNWAGGSGFGEALATGTGYKWMSSEAGANGSQKAVLRGGSNYREATATTTTSSYGNVLGKAGWGEVDVWGAGIAQHATYLPGNTGGGTHGMASYGYEGGNQGLTADFTIWRCHISFGPGAEGSGLATTYGKAWRNPVTNGVASHAVSSSYAYSSGGGSLTN